MKTLYLVLAGLFLSITSIAQIINIPADFPTIQQGINNATNGDTVLVQPGTYVENINFNGKDITVASLYLTTQDTAYASQTIIDGGQSGSVVIFENGESQNAVLTGFTITNGYSSSSGGGIACVYSSPYLHYIMITDNEAEYNGGGIICGAFANPKMDNVIISNNTAGGDGGGIYCYNNCNPSLENVVISGNNSSYHGGGIFCLEYCSPTLDTVSIADNNSKQGGGIYCAINSNIDIDVGMLNNNTATEDGGGIYIEGCSSVLSNLLVSNNSAIKGAGIRAATSNITISFSEFFNNESSQPGGGFSYYLHDTDEVQYYVDMTNCVFDNNSSEYSSGGGVVIGTSSINNSFLDVSITDCQVTNNKAKNRAGLWIMGENVMFNIVKTLFHHNQAETYSGGLSVSVFSEGVFNNCLFSLNEASTVEGDYSGGGGSVWSEAKVDFINCTFANNSASFGTALTVGGGGIANSINCIYWDNFESQISLETYNDLGGNLSMKYNNVKGGTDLIEVSEESVLDWLEGNIDQNPLFMEAGDHECQTNDNSPCIDAGTPDTTGLNLPAHDLAGEPRIFNDRVDMGAYEWNTFVGIEESTSFTSNDNLKLESYPNPFTTLTTIEYQLHSPQTVTITFYNQFGKEVDRIERKQSAGTQKVIWTPHLPGGIYYFRLGAGEQVASRKVVKVL